MTSVIQLGGRCRGANSLRSRLALPAQTAMTGSDLFIPLSFLIVVGSICKTSLQPRQMDLKRVRAVALATPGSIGGALATPGSIGERTRNNSRIFALLCNLRIFAFMRPPKEVWLQTANFADSAHSAVGLQGRRRLSSGILHVHVLASLRHFINFVFCYIIFLTIYFRCLNYAFGFERMLLQGVITSHLLDVS